MIARLTGEIVDKEPGLLVLDLSGVGYAVSAGPGLCGRLEVGQTRSLFISTQVREDSITLYGFETGDERRLFVQLLGVSGVGPKMALALLDTLGFDGFCRAIQEENQAGLCKVSGVGKKTAQRLLLELRGKVSVRFEPTGGAPFAPSKPGKPEDPLRLALARLGYKKSEIDRAVAGVEAAGEGDHNLQQRLSASLRVLSGRMA